MDKLDRNDTVREADWKMFRELREIALERLCERTLGEIDKLLGGDGSYHQRYLKIYELIHQRDKQIADGFNGPRRSSMYEHLTVICRLGLLEPDEIARFSVATQERMFPGN